MASQIVQKPSFLKFRHLQYLIIDAPTDRNLHQYVKEFAKFGVTDLVRACPPSYETDAVVSAGIKVHEMAFEDGAPPPNDVIGKWLALCDTRFAQNRSAKDADRVTVAVHCVAGLGRAPVLVAVALMEAGMQPLEAVAFIRKHRPGAINHRQLKYVEGYKPRKSGCCIIL